MMSHEAAPPPVPPAEESAAGADDTVSRADFDRFYRDYRPRLLRFVRQSARTDDLPEARLDAEGVVQETFEAAFIKWATIEHPERWIYTVAARKVRRHSRQEWLQDRELQQRLQAECSKGSDNDPAHTHAIAEAIVNRIMTLPTNQRIATYLSTVEEWTGPEIATVLDIAPATAYVHVNRGINAVRRSEDYSPRYCCYSPPRTRMLVALAALLVNVGVLVGLIIYPKLALGLGVLIVGVATVWLLVAGARWCTQQVSQAFWRRQGGRRRK